MSEHVSPKSRLQVAVQESKSMDDGLINAPFQVVQPSGKQFQRKKELSLSTSESEVELPNGGGRRSQTKRQKLKWNRPQELVQNSVKVEHIVNPHALPPSQLFGVRSSLAPRVIHSHLPSFYSSNNPGSKQ